MAIRPSLRLFLLLLVSHLAALAAAHVAAIPSAWSLFLSIAILSSLMYRLFRDVWMRLPSSWRALSIEQDEVVLVRHDGAKLIGHIAAGTFVHPAFILLRIRREGRRNTVARVLFPDALGQEAFRELSVRLRLSEA